MVFGEVGLSGEVRQVSQADIRLKEAAKLGFTRALAPRRKRGEPAGAIEVHEVTRLQDMVDLFGTSSARG